MVGSHREFSIFLAAVQVKMIIPYLTIPNMILLKNKFNVGLSLLGLRRLGF